jgi:hypothetical protein
MRLLCFDGNDRCSISLHPTQPTISSAMKKGDDKQCMFFPASVVF